MDFVVVSVRTVPGNPFDTIFWMWHSQATVFDMMENHSNVQQTCHHQSSKPRDRSDEEWILHLQFPTFPLHSIIPLACSLCLSPAIWLVKFHPCAHTFFYTFSRSHTSQDLARRVSDKSHHHLPALHNASKICNCLLAHSFVFALRAVALVI